MKPLSPIGRLFSGVVDERFFPYPRLDPGEKGRLRKIAQAIRRLPEKELDARTVDKDEKISAGMLKRAARLGLFGSFLPKKYSGLGLSQKAYLRIIEELSRRNCSFATVLGVHQNLGCRALLLYGTGEQKARWLPKLASGALICSTAISERSTGSDLASIKMRAVLDRSGGFYRISGEKDFITNAELSDLFVTFVKVARGPSQSYTCLLVPRTSSNFHVGLRDRFTGIKGTCQNRLHFNGVKVPIGNRLRGEGDGLEIMMNILGMARLGVAITMLGTAKRVVELCAADTSKVRRFGETVSQLGMVRQMTGRMAAEIFALESACFFSAHLLDLGGGDFSLETSLTKILGSETAIDVAQLGMFANGGRGYMLDYPYEGLLRDALFSNHGEGPNDALRSAMALRGIYLTRQSQGARTGSWVSRLAQPLKSDAREIDALLAAFGKASTRIYSNPASITRNQMLQKRVADILIDFYALLCCASRTSALCSQAGQPALLLWKTFFDLAVPRIRANIDSLGSSDETRIRELSDSIHEAKGYPLDPTEIPWMRP